MIAKSDLIILTLSTAALVFGLYRWQHAGTGAPTGTVAASSFEAGVARAPDDVVSVTRLPREEAVARVAGPDAVAAVRRLAADGEPDVAAVPTVVEARPAPVTAAPQASADPGYGTYRVRRGDYLGLIAERFGTSVATLRELNGIRGSTIQVGQAIRYPLP